MRPDPNRRTALYRLYDQTDRLLYIGVAFDPQTRWYQHASESAWWREVARHEMEWIDTRGLATLAEAEAIKTERPLHNVVHQPDRLRPRLVNPQTAEKGPATRHTAAASTDALDQAALNYARLLAERERVRTDLQAEAVRALQAGVRQVDVVHKTGWTREYLRRLRQKAEAEAAKPPASSP